MFKKLVLFGASVAIITLSGCASPHQSNQALGAIVGGAVGHALNVGPAGTAIGMIVGADIGRNTPVQGHHTYTYIQTQPSYYNVPVCYVNQHRFNQLAAGCESNFRYNRDIYTRGACLESAQRQATACH
jgi:uncharacterized protein YcfJ